MKKGLVLLLAALLVFACAACSTQNQDVQNIVLSEVTHSVFYAPQYVAIEKGYFADEGLKVELINGGGADKVMTSVLTGEADIGFAGPEAAIYVHNQGKENAPVVFAQMTKRDGSFLVGRKDQEVDRRGKPSLRLYMQGGCSNAAPGYVPGLEAPVHPRAGTDGRHGIPDT